MCCQISQRRGNLQRQRHQPKRCIRLHRPHWNFDQRRYHDHECRHRRRKRKPGTGIDIFSFGTIANQSRARSAAISDTFSEVSIVNAGMVTGNITASGGAGVSLSAFDNGVINQSGGMISGFSGIDAREAPQSPW